MTSKGDVKADTGGLERMSSELRGSTNEVEGTASSSPPMPQVTTSSDKVSYTLGESLKALASLIESTHDTADKIHASNGSYGDMDNQAQLTIDHSGTGLK